MHRLTGTATAGVVDELGRLDPPVTVRLLLACRNSAWRRDLLVGALGTDGTRSRAVRRRVINAIRRLTPT